MDDTKCSPKIKRKLTVAAVNPVVSLRLLPLALSSPGLATPIAGSSGQFQTLSEVRKTFFPTASHHTHVPRGWRHKPQETS